MKIRLMNRRGSNFIYVVVLVALLGILATGFTALVLYNAHVSKAQRNYQEDYYAAMSLRQSVVDSITAGNNSAAQALEARALADYQANGAFGESYSTAGTTTLDNGSVKTTLTYYPSTATAAGYLKLQMDFTLDGNSQSLGATIKATGGTITQPSGTSSAEYAMGLGGGITSGAFGIHVTGGTTLITSSFTTPSSGKISYDGDIVSLNAITVQGGPHTMNGSLYAKNNISISGGSETVNGSVFSEKAVNLYGGPHAISGSIWAVDSVYINNTAGITVGGAVYTNGTATVGGTISGGVTAGGAATVSTTGVVNGDVIAAGNVDISGTVNGNVVAGGTVTVHYGAKVTGNITAAGAVTVNNTVDGNVISGSTVTVNWGASVAGTVTAKGAVTSHSNTGAVTQNDAAVSVSAPVIADVKTVTAESTAGFAKLDAATLPTENGATPALDYKSVTGITNKGELSYDNSNASSRTVTTTTLDANDSDVYYTITNNKAVTVKVTLDLSTLTVAGTHRVFLVVGDNVTLTLTGTMTDSTPTLASRLFIVTAYDNTQNVTIGIDAGSTFYGQIYAPGATFALKNRGDYTTWTVNGMVTAGSTASEGSNEKDLYINYVAGNYTGTNLASAFGGSGGSSGGTYTPISGWKAVSYYDVA